MVAGLGSGVRYGSSTAEETMKHSHGLIHVPSWRRALGALEDFDYFQPEDAKITRAVKRLRRMVVRKLEAEGAENINP